MIRATPYEPMSIEVPIVIEVPRFSFIKRGPTGAVDFVSPLPSPFNYGSIPGTHGEDGEPRDVVLLGPRLPRGTRTHATVLGVVGFLDAGTPDPKLVAGARLDPWSETQLHAFFRVYALAKRLTGRRPTAYEGLTHARDFVEIESLLT